MSRSSRRRDAASAQLPLFEQALAPVAAESAPDPMPAVHEEAARLAARLPTGLHLGTSSWSFPGWQGIVYSKQRTTEELARDGLAEYARHPLLTTVGIDRSFYAPVPASDYLRYARQLPDGFRCVSKALHAVVAQTLHPWQPSRAPHVQPTELTASTSDGTSEGGASEGAPGAGGDHDRDRIRPNPDFLSIPVFLERVAAPLLSAFRSHAGPVLFEMPKAAPSERLPPQAFFARLDAFLGALPPELDYAIELRERAYFTGEYREILRAHRVAHAYTYWRDMPSPGAQARVVPVANAPFVVVRLSLKAGRRYNDEKERFRPFDRVVEPDPAMRDKVTRILCEAATLPLESFVLVNNKAEGCAPLTVRAIAEQVAEAWTTWQPRAASG